METRQDHSGIIARWHAGLPLMLPALAGIAYLVAAGAPGSFAIVNAGALAVGLALIALVRFPASSRARIVVFLALCSFLALPLAFGPWIDSISRWIAVGGFTLHTGFLAAPLLVRIAAGEIGSGPWFLLAAILLAFAQPDFATCLALSCGALTIAISNRNGTMLAVTVLGFAASIGASFAAPLPPQTFVERILPELWVSSSLAASALALSLIAGAGVLLATARIALPQRLALLGCMTGFVIAAFLGDYPYPLIGYGAASLLGFAIALITPRPAARS